MITSETMLPQNPPQSLRINNIHIYCFLFHLLILHAIILYCYMNIKPFLGLNHLWSLTYIVIYLAIYYYIAWAILFTHFIESIHDSHRFGRFESKSLHCTNNTISSILSTLNVVTNILVHNSRLGHLSSLLHSVT